jgi:hypothetical protein
VITSWSRKSRNKLREVFGQLDWTPLFAEGGIPAMVTLTYPGDWLAVAPHAAACKRHLDLFRKRYERAWGRKLIGAWKREFQRRGAPHYHFLMVPPTGTADGMGFRVWLSVTWANIVAAERCWGDLCSPSNRCEYHAHKLAGTGVDYADGLKATDPQAAASYFLKHGSFADKEYQNQAPDEWVEAGSVGRYWGYWGLSKAVAGTYVEDAEARAAVRTLRRYSRAQGVVARVPVWRYRTVVDPDTGEVSARWRKSSTKRRIYHLRHGAGYLTSEDAPALLSQVARHLDRLRRPDAVIGRSGAGPIGFLP